MSDTKTWAKGQEKIDKVQADLKGISETQICQFMVLETILAQGED